MYVLVERFREFRKASVCKWKGHTAPMLGCLGLQAALHWKQTQFYSLNQWMGSGVLQETVSCCIHKLNFKLNQYRYRKKKQPQNTQTRSRYSLEKSWGSFKMDGIWMTSCSVVLTNKIVKMWRLFGLRRRGTIHRADFTFSKPANLIVWVTFTSVRVPFLLHIHTFTPSFWRSSCLLHQDTAKQQSACIHTAWPSSMRV